MGTVTFTQDADGYSPLDGSNGGIWIRGKITMSNSYATGGDTITGALVGLGSITKLEIAAGAAAAGAGTTAFIGNPVYDSTNVNVTKIQVYQSAAASNPLTEVPNATNLSTIVFDAEIYGI